MAWPCCAPPHYIGHNPAGAMMIFALIAVLVGLVVTGLLVLGGEEKQGLLKGVASYAVGNAAKEVHETLVWLLLAMVCGHLAGVAVESWLTRDNLTRAMITGRKRLPASEPVPQPRRARPVLAAVMTVVLCLVTTVAVVAVRKLASPVPRPLLMDPLYAEECGACHGPIHPSLLPNASWRAVMETLEDHFGENAVLSRDSDARITAWLEANAAETWDTEAAWRYRNVSTAEPRRITATAYWVRKHEGIEPSVFARKSVGGKANCAACHKDAQSGLFADQSIAIPKETMP
ncbi:MAG: cytochrome b/b6 domain-containing protein [Alphaproteobacteria bacterium]